MTNSAAAAAVVPRLVVKQEQFVRFYTDGTVLCRDCRLAYPHAFEPYKGKDAGAKAKYGTVGLWPKADKARLPSVKMIADHIKIMMAENRTDEIAATNKFLRNGDLSGKADFKGNWTISASELRPPTLRSNRRDPRSGKVINLQPGRDNGVIYGGCWANILIRPWWMNNNWGKKVNAGLVAIQFLRDDEPFGQGRVAEEDIDATFDEFADDSDSGFDDTLGDDDDL